MSKLNVCFIGTSQLVRLYEIKGDELDKRYNITYIAAGRSCFDRSDFFISEDGRLTATSDEFNDVLESQGNANNDMRTYDYIIFVGFTPLFQSNPIITDIYSAFGDKYFSDGFSKNVADEVVARDTPFKLIDIIDKVRRKDSRLIIVQDWRPSKIFHILDYNSKAKDLRSISQHLIGTWAERCVERNIKYISQPPETLDDNKSLTKLEYIEWDGFHLNEDAVSIVCNQICEEIS